MTVQKHKHIIWKWWFDASLTYGAIIGSLVSVPQAWEIWVGHNASGVSLVSWTGYMIGNFVWLSYGLVHKEKPIISAYILAFPISIAIVIGIVVYG
jgi:uncharacterized protein with PQ loop repeat